MIWTMDSKKKKRLFTVYYVLYILAQHIYSFINVAFKHSAWSGKLEYIHIRRPKARKSFCGTRTARTRLHATLPTKQQIQKRQNALLRSNKEKKQNKCGETVELYVEVKYMQYIHKYFLAHAFLHRFWTGRDKYHLKLCLDKLGGISKVNDNISRQYNHHKSTTKIWKEANRIAVRLILSKTLFYIVM